MRFNHCPPVHLEDLTSETTDAGRFYTLPDGIILPSVTTVLKEIYKNQSLEEWKNKVGVVEAHRVSSIATNRGTNTHTICENYLNNRPDYMQGIMPDAVEYFLSIKPYLNKINNIWYQEQALWSKMIGAAGRVDCIAEYDGVLSIIDFKTSSWPKTREEIIAYFVQECMYALMLQDMIGEKVKQLVTIMAVRDKQPLIFIEKTKDYVVAVANSMKTYKQLNDNFKQ